MGGLFDPLQGRSGDQERNDGITALDLMDLPPAHYRVMRLMLRRGEMNYLQLGEANIAQPEGDRLSQVELDEALKSLCDQRWLIQQGEGQTLTYKLNLRRKVSNALSTFAKRNQASSTLSKSIWDALDPKHDQDNPPQDRGDNP
jgi:hypothetical protein